MSITVEAVFENGVLKPIEPVPLEEHEKVRITVHKQSNWVENTSGFIHWQGDPATLERLAIDPEFDPDEAKADLHLEWFGKAASPKSPSSETL